jgi:hypothetical protein
MTWTKKYFYTFKSLNNDSYEIQILHTGVSGATQITSDQVPFVVDYPESKKFEAVRGSGCDMNLISETDRQFIGLYSNEIQKYQIRLIKNSSQYPSWLGYLDSETYTEDFGSLKNYPVKFTGTDGFALLNRLLFVDGSGNKYSGQISQWNLLKIILNKVGLPYNSILVALSTTSPQLTINSGETIFHKSYVVQENFYDEDGKPMTCRQVLEAILKPYGAMIMQANGNIVIYDYNSILSSPCTFKEYNSTSYAYVQPVSINTNLGDLSTIGFTSDNQNLELVPAINKQTLKYSAYNLSTLNNFSASASDFTNIGSTTHKNTDANYGWDEYTWNASKSIVTGGYGAFRSLQGIGNLNTASSFIYVKFLPVSSFSFVGFNFKNKPFLLSNLYTNNPIYFLKISMSAYFRTKLKEGDPSELSYSNLQKASIYLNIRCGGSQFKLDIWGASATTTNITTLKLDYYNDNINDTIADTWINNRSYSNTLQKNVDYVLVPLNYILIAPLDIQVLQAFLVTDKNGVDKTANLQDIRINGLSCEISDKNGNVQSASDTEYISYLDAKNNNEGQKIEVIQGSNSFDYPVQMGAITDNINNLKSHTRAGITAKLEELLLNSVVSNYQNPRIKLTVDSNILNFQIGYVTYNNYLSGLKLVPLGIKIDYSMNTNNLVLIETVSDNLTPNYL